MLSTNALLRKHSFKQSEIFQCDIVAERDHNSHSRVLSLSESSILPLPREWIFLPLLNVEEGGKANAIDEEMVDEARKVEKSVNFVMVCNRLCSCKVFRMLLIFFLRQYHYYRAH